MTKQEKDRVLEIAEELGIGAEEHGSYSGRFMFGERTEAVIFPSVELAAEVAGYYRAKHGERLVFRWDDMGKSDIIMY